MRIRGLRAILAAMTVLSLAGCGEDENPMTGSWSGTASATSAGQTLVVQLAVTLSQSGESLSGSFEATNPAGNVDRGSMAGSVRGSAVSLSFMPSSAGACPASSQSTFTGNRISGPLQINCPGQPPLPGTLELMKR
jgi:hypothetical protein